MLDQNLEGVAQKMRLPRPSEAQNWKGRGRLNFWATALKFCTSTYFSKIFKWYLYDIFIFPLVSYFEKMQKSDMSRLQWSLVYYCQVLIETLIWVSFQYYICPRFLKLFNPIFDKNKPNVALLLNFLFTNYFVLTWLCTKITELSI